MDQENAADFRRFLRSTATAMEPDEVLRAPAGSLIGVSPSAESALARLEVRSVFDLAASRVFAAASRLAAMESDATTVEARLNVVARDIAELPPGVPARELSRQPIRYLRDLAGEAGQAVESALDVGTIRDLALWPPYQAARIILASAYFPERTPGYDSDAPAELLPKAGNYPTERIFFRKLIIDTVPPAIDGAQPIETSGPIDLATALAAPAGFDRLATGALLTLSQSWYSQGLTLGQLLHSTSLAPGESTRIAVVDWSRRSRAAASEDVSESELLSNTMTHSRSLSEVTNATAREFQSGRSSTRAESTTAQAGGGFGLELGPVAIGGSGGISNTTTEVMSASSSFGARDLAASYAQDVNDRSQQNASSVRNRRASIVREVSQSEHEQISTRVLTNYNHMHALSVHYYEVVQAFRTTTQLERAERCLFVPVKLVDFRDSATIDRWRLVLADAALSERARRQLTVEYGVVEIIPQTPRLRTRDLLARGLVSLSNSTATMARRALPAAIKTAAVAAVSNAPAGDAGSSPSATHPAPAPASSPAAAGGGPAITANYLSANVNAPATLLALKGWDLEQLSRVGWATGRVLMQAGSDSAFVSDDALVEGLSLREGQAARFVIRQHDGAEVTPAVTNENGLTLHTPIPLTALASIAVQFTGSQELRTGLVLRLNLLGTVMPLDVPVVLRPLSVPVEVVKFGPVRSARELIDHLEANRLHYTQAILRGLDVATVAALLSRYTYRGLPLGQLVDPQPIAVMANFLVFKMNIVAGGEPDDPRWAEEQRSWEAWLKRRGLDQPAPRTEIIPIPSGGVFAEAVLGRYNSAEKTDLTRFWNWQDSPIPITAPELAPLQAGSRAQSEDIRPGQLSAPVLTVQTPTALPDPTGIAAIITAVQSGNLFRDMSGMAQTAALAQAALQASAAGATAVGQQAGQNLATVMANNTERMRIAAQVATGGAGGGGAGSRPAKNVTEEGARLNFARDLDSRTQGGATGTSAKSKGTATGSQAEFARSAEVSQPETSREADLFERQTGGVAADTAEQTLSLVNEDETAAKAGESGAGGSGGPPFSPFPERLTETVSAPQAKRLKLGKALKDAFTGALQDPRSPGLVDLTELPFVIVALDDDGTRPLSGQRHFEMHYSGSLLKVASLYAAYQLRVAVNDFAAALDPAVVDTSAKLFARIEKVFDPQIENAVDLINTNKPPVPKILRVPAYSHVFGAAKTGAGGKWVLDFKNVEDGLDRDGLRGHFAGHLERSIVGSHNESAGFCVRALGYSWINGALQAAGLLDLSLKGQEGIWLAGDYGGQQTVEIPSLNDKLVKQATTCFHMGLLFALLLAKDPDKRLVKNNVHPTTGLSGNDEMIKLLERAVDDSDAASLLKRVTIPFTVLLGKIGVGNLKEDPNQKGVPGSCNRGNVHGCVFSEAAVLQHSSGRKFVVVWQNMLDGKISDLRRIVAVIQKIMDDYVAP